MMVSWKPADSIIREKYHGYLGAGLGVCQCVMVIAERNPEEIAYVRQRETWADRPGNGPSCFHDSAEKWTVGEIHLVNLVGSPQAPFIESLVMCNER